MGVTQCRYSIKDIKKDSSKLQDYLPSLKWECEEEKESQYLLWLKHGHMSIVYLLVQEYLYDTIFKILPYYKAMLFRLQT